MDRSLLKQLLVGVFAACTIALGCAADKRRSPPDYESLSFEDTISWPKPEVATFTLQNGIRCLLIEEKDLPLIEVYVTVRSGEFLVSANRTGLAEITGMVMRSGGSERYPAEKLNRLLAGKAAQMETAFAFISGSARMNILREDFKTLLPVFVDLLKQPVFPEDKVRLAKQQLKARIARRNDEQSSIAMRTYRRLIYGPDSVYAREPEYETVEGISREDLIDFHRRAYQGANLMVGMVGDFDSETILPIIEKAFSVFPPGEKINIELPCVDRSEEVSFYVVEKGDVNQSYLLMGHLGGWRQDPDYAAIQVMNRILSGGFSGRLFEKVRTQRGLAYSVFGQYGCNFFYPGIFFVGLSTRTPATAEAVTVVKSVLEGLHQQVGAVELEQAKEQFFSSLVFRYDQAGEILERRMYYAYRDMDEESFQKLIQEIREVTSRDVLRVAREYLRPDGLTVLSVGEEEKLVEQLQTLGDVAVLPQP